MPVGKEGAVEVRGRLAHSGCPCLTCRPRDQGSEAEEAPVVGCPDIAEPPDGSITGADLRIVAHYIGSPVTMEEQLWADLSVDNNVTGADLSVVAAKIGAAALVRTVA